MQKINLQLMWDKIFRRTVFLRPLPDKTFEAVDITGQEGQYIKDKIGATAIDPACLVRVRGLKRVDYIAIKLSGSPSLMDIFDGSAMTVTPPPVKVKLQDIKVSNPNIKIKPPDHSTKCPECQKDITITVPEMESPVPDAFVSLPEIEVAVPKVDVVIPKDQSMSEKTFGDMLNYAEIAGRMQAEHSPEADKKMNMILLAVLAAVGIGVIIFFKMKSAGA